MADGRAWPGFQLRCCPVCGVEVGTHRERVDDDRGEVVAYHDHQDTSGPALRDGARTGRDPGRGVPRFGHRHIGAAHRDNLLHRRGGTARPTTYWTDS